MYNLYLYIALCQFSTSLSVDVYIGTLYLVYLYTLNQTKLVKALSLWLMCPVISFPDLFGFAHKRSGNEIMCPVKKKCRYAYLSTSTITMPLNDKK